MTLPYNVFGTTGIAPHRRWIVSGGGVTGDQQYCWSSAMVPGPGDWNGPFLYPQLPDLGTGYNMTQVEYDPDRDMFVIVGTLRGLNDPGQPNAYPNWSPYVLRSFDLMDTWETPEIPLNVAWLNVEPGLWGGGNVGHLHYDPLRRRMYMLGGLTNSGFWSRPDTSDHVSYSDDGCLTWTTFASQKADAGDSWGWGNSSWFIRQRRPPHFQLAQGTTVAACGYVVARRAGATDGWLISLGGPPEDTVNDLPTDIEGGGLTDAINRIDRDFWGLSPIPGEPGWLIGNQNLASATSQVGSLMKTSASDLSAFFWDDDLPDEAVVETVDDTDFEGNKYEGAASGSFPVRHGRIVIAAGRMWSVTGWAGFEIGDDQLVSSAGGGIWRRDQDFRLQLPAENEYGGHGAFKQHPFFDRSAYSATGAIHDIAQNRQRPDLLMCVGRIANAARYSSISNRFLCYSMSEDGGSTWSPPMQFPPTMNQPYYVWSV